MKKTVIIYKSSTGFTEKYAKWLNEELDSDLIPYEKRGSVNLSHYDTIIYGGGLYAGSINGISWLKSKLPELKEKEVVVFATGAMPADAPEIKETMEKNLAEEAGQVKGFFLHSGLCYEKMAFKHKLMMKMFCKMMKKKDPEVAQFLSASFDHTSKETLQPLIQHVKTQRESD